MSPVTNKPITCGRKSCGRKIPPGQPYAQIQIASIPRPAPGEGGVRRTPPPPEPVVICKPCNKVWWSVSVEAAQEAARKFLAS